MVRISRCCSPLSPTACRTAVILLLRVLRNDSAVPHFGNQIILADNTFAIADEVLQEVKDLRFDRDDIASTPQFTPLGIE